MAGDIVRITLGSKVPADLRLLEVSSDLRFDRSILTGESNAVAAAVDATDDNCKSFNCPMERISYIILLSHGIQKYRPSGNSLY